MSFFSKLAGEFVDIVEWMDDSNDTLVYRFERHGNEIKYGAQLVVREGQHALFVNEGQLADGFTPGTYTLETQNIPVLSTLRGWKHGFASPFKAEVYFVSLRGFTNLKWGTKQPIIVRDPEFGPVRLRGFGSYTIRVVDPRKLLTEIVGTDGHFTVDEISGQLRDLFVSRFANLLAESRIPLLDLSTRYDALGDLLEQRLGPEFAEYGLALVNPLVENISLPEEVEQALDKRSSINIVGNLGNFSQFQAATAMEKAAQNTGPAGGMMGVGVGLAMGQQASAPTWQQPSPPTPAAPPPPAAENAQYHLVIQGQQQGPYDLTGVRQWIAAGQLRADSLIWKNGLPQWVAADRLPELAPLFGAASPPPPPLPPGGGPPPLPEG
nr:conserved uncharacterized protein [uncultured bacterium]